MVRYHLNPVLLLGVDLNFTKVLNVSIVESISSIAFSELSRTKVVNLEGSISNSSWFGCVRLSSSFTYSHL